MSNPESGNEDRVVVTGTTADFHTNSQQLLDRGYEVIPGTIQLAMTLAKPDSRSALYHCVCVAFFRKKPV